MRFYLAIPIIFLAFYFGYAGNGGLVGVCLLNGLFLTISGFAASPAPRKRLRLVLSATLLVSPLLGVWFGNQPLPLGWSLTAVILVAVTACAFLWEARRSRPL